MVKIACTLANISWKCSFKAIHFQAIVKFACLIMTHAGVHMHGLCTITIVFDGM